MANYAESVAIREAFLRSLTDLEDSATQPMIRAYTQALERIEADVRKSLAADNPLGQALRDSFAGAEDTARVAVIRGRSEFIAAQFDRFAKDGSSAIRMLAPNAYRLGLDAATQQVGTVAANVTTPNRRAIEQAAARYLPGTVQREWLEGFARESTQQVVDDLVSTTVLGENPNRVAMRVRKHGTMGTARIRTFVHTETLGAARAGISDLYRDNSDILQGWIWNAEETSQTCEVCWAMNGTQHDLSEDLDSHPNCRCVQEPMTKTWEQLSEEFGDGFADVPETAARPFDPDERFRSVLSPDEQLKVLGAGKYALYRDGKIRLADLVTPTVSDKWGRGLRATTLRELRERGVESASVLDQVAGARALSETAAAVTPAVDVLDAKAFAKFAADTWDAPEWRGNGAPIMNRLLREYGYDAKPTIMADAEYEAAADATNVGRLYRGLGDRDTQTATEMIDQFQTGDLYAGYGIYGNGTYATPNAGDAWGYMRGAAEDEGRNAGAIMHFTLADDARVLDLDAIKESRHVTVIENGEYVDSVRPEGHLYAEFAKWERDVRKAMEAHDVNGFDNLVVDSSHFAIAKGYDAVKVTFPMGGDPYYVILNRGKVIVRESAQRETF